MSASVNEGPAEPAIADGCPSFEGLSDEEYFRIFLRRLGETLIDVLAPDDPPTELELAESEAQAAGRGVEFRAELDKRQREQEEEEARQREAELAERAQEEALKNGRRNWLNKPRRKKNANTCEVTTPSNQKGRQTWKPQSMISQPWNESHRLKTALASVLA